jgi:hypothetical protein
MAAAGSSETLVSTYQTTASHPRGQIFIAEDSNKSHVYVEFSVEMQGLKVLPKPSVSTREMGKIYKCTGL